MKKLLLIDGNSLAYRGFFSTKASPNGLVYSADGVPTSVCRAFLGSIKKLRREQNPTHLCICFDPGGKTWRHKLYPAYKGKRSKDENYDDFLIDLRNLKSILAEMNITTVVIDNNEADDAIASIAYQKNKTDLQILISSADKDLLQLVNDELDIGMLWSHGQVVKTYTEALVFEEYNVRADQISDFKALVGDDSDNIPGVKGIGKISAAALLGEYDDVESIASDLGNVKKTLQKKIEPELDNMLMFKNLTKLKTNLDVCVQFEQFSVDRIKSDSAIAAELGLLS